MSDETPNVDELKEEERMKIDIPVEDDTGTGSAKSAEYDVVGEFKKLGRQFAATLETVLTSDEVKRLETEVREGLKGFAGEVDRAIQEVKTSQAASRMKDEATAVRERVETGEVTHKAQESVVMGLRWLSGELDKLADQFATKGTTPPAEKSPDDVA